VAANRNPQEQFIDCVMQVRALLSPVMDEVNPDALLVTEQCAEMLMDAVKKYQTEGELQ
jgi:hypothetical protein